MSNLLQDIRYAIRTLLQRPAFSGIAILTLALGIGANTALFSVVNAVLLQPLPYPEADRLAKIYSTRRNTGEIHENLSPRDFMDFAKESTLLEEAAAMGWLGFATLTGEGEPERLGAVLVTAGFFPALKIEAALGRTFRRDEDRPGGPAVAILSHGIWQRRFGGDPNIIGRTIEVNAVPTTVIGILPAAFRHPEPNPERDADIYRLHQFDPATASRSGHFIRGIARLRAGVSLAEVQAELTAVAARLEQAYPDSNLGKGVAIYPLRNELVRDSRPALLLLMGAVGFVLLIACANVANLLLANGAGRHRELAIRTALGAGRGRLVRQLVTEAGGLGVLGGAAGLLLAYWSRRLLTDLTAVNVPWPDRIGIDWSVLLFALGLALFTSVLFGLAPALQLSRISPQDGLKEGVRGSSFGAASSRTRTLLVVAEVALSLVLLMGAGLLIKSFWKLHRVDPGFAPERVLSLQMSLPTAKYEEGEQIPIYERLYERLAGIAGVEAVGAINILPLSDNYDGNSFQIDDRPVPENQQPSAEARSISPGYFTAMGIPLVRGRAFTDQDTDSARRVAIISQSMARRFWGDEDAIGKRITYNRSVPRDEQKPSGGPGSREIVGIVGDVKHLGLDEAGEPMFYTPQAQQPSFHTMTLVLRTALAPADLAATVRSEVGAIDPDVPLYSIQTLDRLVSRAVAQPRFRTLLLGLFAGLALLLALFGIYGVIAYGVTQRVHEIGVRMALGANASDVVSMLLAQGLTPVAIGIVLGIAGSLALTRLLSSLLFGTTATDPVTYLMIPPLLAAAAILASIVPALRATRIDPVIALRNE